MELNELVFCAKICAFSLAAIALFTFGTMVYFLIIKEPSVEIYSRLNTIDNELIKVSENFKRVYNHINNNVLIMENRLNQHRDAINENFKEANRREKILESRNNQLLAILDNHRIEINKLCKKKSVAKRT